MTPDTVTFFLTCYLHGLLERTRAEKTGAKYGFDWIVYNCYKNWIAKSFESDLRRAAAPNLTAGGLEDVKPGSSFSLTTRMNIRTASRHTSRP